MADIHRIRLRPWWIDARRGPMMATMPDRIARTLLASAVTVVIAAVACLATAPVIAADEPWPPAPRSEAIRLHADLPDVLQSDWIERLGLFADVPHLVRVRFGRSDWGSVLARLEIVEPGADLRVVVRSLSGETWRALRERAELVLAGQPPPPPPSAGADAGDDPLAGVRSWPETPPPPAAPPRLPDVPDGGIPLRGRWLALVEAGMRLNVSSFNSIFSPMGQLGLAFGYGVSERVIPCLGFGAGFGDMRGDFEDAFGDGRANTFGFSLTTLLRQPLGQRQSVYVEGGGGYFIRSLYWGGAFVDPVTGEITEGRVLEQQNFGWLARVGWLLRRDHPRRPRLLDVGLSLQTSRADPWVYWTDDVRFSATERDTWLILSVRFWDGL
jgi:hypothetical protein